MAGGSEKARKKTDKQKSEERELTQKLNNDDNDDVDGAAEGETGEYEVELPPPPDGGWGWVIVAASLLANIIVDGITYTFGIFLPKFQEAFDEPRGTIALAGSLQVGTYLCAGPIVSALTNRFGCKMVTMVGSVVATLGFVLSVFAPNAQVLIFTYGIIGGFGFGMMYLPAIVVVGYYFEKKRALATGIAVCGSGIGMFIMAPLSDLLLHEFGHQGALLIIAGIVFNGAICGALMRPLPTPKIPVNGGNSKHVTNGQTPETTNKERPIYIGPVVAAANDADQPDNDGDNNTKPSRNKKDIPGIVVLDGGEAPKKPASGRSEQFGFSSVPNMVFSSAREPRGGHKRGGDVAPRQRSMTMNHDDTIQLRHVGKSVTGLAHAEAPTKKSTAPIGLSYIGLSDANINQVRATTHTNVSRRNIFLSGSVLHIPDHSVRHGEHLRSAVSMRSYRSGMSDVEQKVCACLPESARDTLLQMLDFSIMRNQAYVLILVGNVFAMLGFYVPFVFMPEKALSIGVSEKEAAFLLSIIGITNTVGRVMTGVLANLNMIDSLIINNIAMLLCGLATFVTPFCGNYILLCVVSAVFGLCVAAYISLSSILLCDMLGLEQLTNAFGFLTLARGVSSCAGSPMAGAIIDATNDYDIAFYVGGALIILGSLFHFMLHTPCIRQKPKERDIDI